MLGHLLLAISACLPVAGDRIRIQDVAAAIPGFAGHDEQESIAFAPAPGVQRRFSAAELGRLAARKDIATEVEPLCFERKLAPLASEQVLLSLRRALPEGAQLELLTFSDSPVPAGSLEFPRIGLSRPHPASPREPVIWKGRVTYATAQSAPIWAKVRVWISFPTVVAAEELPAGKPIATAQLRLEAADFTPFVENADPTIEQMSGMIPRRTIRAGALVLKSAIDAPAEITRGEMVGVEAHVGAAYLKFEVRAEVSGRTGDLVQVRNIGSGKTFRARVVRKGWVAVE